MDRATFVVQADPNGWHTRVELVRMDPAQFSFRVRGRLRDLAPDWTVDRAPATATLAMNIGLYSGIVPWGWTVMAGQEVRAAGARARCRRPIAWDAAGRMRWLAPDQIAPARAAGDVIEAIQSYPTLLDASGGVPVPLRQRGLGVDIDHRDGRLAIGELDDGRMLIAMTRFYPLGDLSPAIPLGLTLDEMARRHEGPRLPSRRGARRRHLRAVDGARRSTHAHVARLARRAVRPDCRTPSARSL